MSETSPHDPGPEAAGDRGERHATAAREPLTIGGATVRIGTASWTDPTMTAPGVFYPPDATTAEDRLVYYADQFPIVEVDATYYALPIRRHGRALARAHAAGLHVRHQGPRPDDRAAVGGRSGCRRTSARRSRRSSPRRSAIYAQDLPAEIDDAIWARFLDGIEPLRTAGKLGAVFLQYPRWFFPSNESRDEIVEARRSASATCPSPSSSATASWFNEKNRERTIALPREIRDPVRDGRRAADQDASLPPIIAVTSPKLAVIRFHGRRTETWEASRHPGRRALPLPVRRRGAGRVGAADPRGGGAGARTCTC